jgi:pimeloyl-ACP methyl ester carboxylesterase
VAGFLLHYLQNINIPEDELRSDTPITRAAIPLILGGYSYGSLITSHLPDLRDILKTFSTPEDGSAAAEIRDRAASLAGQMNEQLRVLGAARIHHGRSVHKHGQTLAVGGEETTPEKRRRSTETRRSADVRRSLDLPRTLSQFRRKSHEIKSPAIPPIPVDDITLPRIEAAYLLVSPILSPISNLTALSLKQDDNEYRERFNSVPSLAIFGDDDFFTSAKKLRKWSQAISSKPATNFRYVEIAGAGHFWHDHNAQKALKIAIKEWLGELTEANADAPVPHKAET